MGERSYNAKWGEQETCRDCRRATGKQSRARGASELGSLDIGSRKIATHK
jgi:hypothetical protein